VCPLEKKIPQELAEQGHDNKKMKNLHVGPKRNTTHKLHVDSSVNFVKEKKITFCELIILLILYPIKFRNAIILGKNVS
jgi:hypothetical protein